MCAEGETKGVIKRGEVVTEMCTQGFSFFAHFCVCLCICLYVHAAVHVFNFHASRLALLFLTTHTGPDTHTMSGLLPTD